MSSRKSSEPTESPRIPRTREQWTQYFLAQAEAERARKLEAQLEAQLLVQAARGVRSLVGSNPDVARALAQEEADGPYFEAMGTFSDNLNQLRAQAPTRLNEWPVLSPPDKQTVAGIVDWIKLMIGRVRATGDSARDHDLAGPFGVPSSVGESPQSVIDALHTFKRAAKENPAVVQAARIKPQELAQLDTQEQELDRVLHQKQGNSTAHAGIKAQLRTQSLALEDQLKDLRVKALAAMMSSPALMHLVLDQLPRAPERRRRPSKKEDGAAGNGAKKDGAAGGGSKKEDGSAGSGDAAATGSTGGGTASDTASTPDGEASGKPSKG